MEDKKIVPSMALTIIKEGKIGPRKSIVKKKWSEIVLCTKLIDNFLRFLKESGTVFFGDFFAFLWPVMTNGNA